MKKLILENSITEGMEGKRLDLALAQLYPEYSRSLWQTWISSGHVLVNDQLPKQRNKVSCGDIIKINVTFSENKEILPQEIELDIKHEDESLLIINKQAGLVVHPGAGNPDKTLVNALINHDSNLSILPRAGVIHRLDKDTTGLMIIAKSLQAHTFLVEQLQDRKIKRRYQTIVCGQVTAGASIENKIGRHPAQRTKMAVTHNGKPAVTHYRLIKKFKHYTHLKVELDSGRTHQIRVHMAHINHPVVGDQVYGKHRSIQKGIDNTLKEIVSKFRRQALHAYELELTHPTSRQHCIFSSELPEDIKKLLNAIKKHDA